MFSGIKEALAGRTFYGRFELIVSGFILLLISVIIVYTSILASITVAEDFFLGMQFIETGVVKDTFGLILTILILLEFNHSIVSALRQREGSIQGSIIVLITITVIARKLILLDYASATPQLLLGLGGLALALGALYWLIAGVERRRRGGQ
ncbi:MAG: phosphate-starvation-inducible PsiE family protein [Alphaproteobacteria bacterium]|nr:phosphate-starvation-inducible PsiE family protein [Alphaproteobacteria bacterium]